MICPACKDIMVYDGMSSNRKITDWNRCADCGFSQVFPIPSQLVMSEYYHTGEYDKETKIELDLRYGEGEQRAKNWLGMVPLTTTSHLDFGCGPGGTLDEVKKNFPQIKISHGVDVAGDRADFRMIENANVKYDLVTCFQTLEHLSHPIEMIRKLMHRTEKRLLIEVPLWGRQWPHICQFTTESIGRVMGPEAKLEINGENIYIVWDRKVIE